MVHQQQTINKGMVSEISYSSDSLVSILSPSFFSEQIKRAALFNHLLTRPLALISAQWRSFLPLPNSFIKYEKLQHLHFICRTTCLFKERVR